MDDEQIVDEMAASVKRWRVPVGLTKEQVVARLTELRDLSIQNAKDTVEANARDGTGPLLPILTALMPSGEVVVFGVAVDSEGKKPAYNALSTLLRMGHALGVIQIAEAWSAPNQNMAPSKHPQRQDCVVCSVIRPDPGEMEFHTFPFRCEAAKVVWGEPYHSKAEDRAYNYLMEAFTKGTQ